MGSPSPRFTDPRTTTDPVAYFELVCFVIQEVIGHALETLSEDTHGSLSGSSARTQNGAVVAFLIRERSPNYAEPQVRPGLI